MDHLDIYKIQAEVCEAVLENLHLASILLNDEYEDPDIEKKIMIKGNIPPLIDPNNP